MGNQKLEDGNLCKDCAKQLSPWFSDRRRSTVEDIIKRQLAYREENRSKASQFRTTRSYGEDCKVLLDEEHRWFTVTRARDLADANPDILDYTALTGCRVDIDESRTEQKREGPDGKEVSYNPPRYEYSYDFEVIISVNNPYFDEMKFRLNNSSVYIEPQNTMQRPMMGQQGMMGQRPMAGRPQSGMAGQRPMMNQQGMNQQPAPMGLSDQELAYDLLYQEKALMANISSEVVEGSHAGLRNVLNDMFMQIGQDQLQVFQLMNEQGWYQTKPAPQPELQTAKQKYQQMRQGL